ncbi:MAG: exodeoxyribonuclease VII small subunit [Bacilli bacterium]|jgi:exodeoxyribonuclease VII small subunit|nr:exodeoxyribonuclease VII small subunit [Bacilli bacterium]
MTKEEKFEEKLTKLEAIVKDLESGNIDLDDAINKYTDAMKIAKECSNKLTKAEEQVNKILTENGKLEDYAPEE